jgi:hypothetical protein
LGQLNGYNDVQCCIGDIPSATYSDPPIISQEQFGMILNLNSIYCPSEKSQLFQFPLGKDETTPESELQNTLTNAAQSNKAKAIDTSRKRYGSPSWYHSRSDGHGTTVSTLSGLPDLTSRVRSMFFEVKSAKVRWLLKSYFPLFLKAFFVHI